MPGNNPPHKVVELDKETYDFIIGNCDSNIAFGFRALEGMQSRDLMEKVVANIEQFKKLKKLLENSP